jgi:hypothetical protein
LLHKKRKEAKLSNETSTSINLEVSREEANYILNMLARCPFIEVAALISKIKSQGDAQVEESTPK